MRANSPSLRRSPTYQHLFKASRNPQVPPAHSNLNTQRSNNTTTMRNNNNGNKKSEPFVRATSTPQHRKSPGSTPNTRSRSFIRKGVADVTPLFNFEGSVRFIAVISDRVAWTSDCDGIIRVRSLPKGNEIRALSTRERSFCTCLLFIQSTNKVWAALSDGFILVFDVSTYAREREFIQHVGAVLCMIELEGIVFTGGQDWKVCQWNVQTYQYERMFFGHSNSVRCLFPYSGPTGAVLFSGGDDCTIKAWDPYTPLLQSKEETACKHTFNGHTRGVLALEHVSTMNQLLSGSEDCTIRVWDLQTLKCVSTLVGHSAPVCSVQLVEHRIWSGDKHGRMILWDLKSLNPIQELSELLRVPHSCVFSICKILPTVGWKVWSTGSSGHVQCWNADSMPIVLEDDGIKQPHVVVDGDAHPKNPEEDDVELRDEIGRLNDELRHLREIAKFDQFNEFQTQQVLMDENASLRRQLQDLKEGGPTSSAPENTIDKLHPIREEVTKRGNNRAGESLRKLNQGPPRGTDASLVTHHEHRFTGIGWTDVLGDAPAELRKVFITDASEALGLPVDQIHGVSLSLDKDVLVAKMDVAHSVETSRTDIDEKLSVYRYPCVIEYYAKILSRKHQDFIKHLAAAKNENTTVQGVVQKILKDQKDQEETISKQKNTIATLDKRLEASGKENSLLLEEITVMRKLISQLEENGSPRLTDVQEEYKALKEYVEEKLKPAISRLTRINGENDLDLQAYESRIRDSEKAVVSLKSVAEENRILREQQQIIKKNKEHHVTAPSLVNTEEEYQARTDNVVNRFKPSASVSRRIDSERGLILEANEKIIRDIRQEIESLRVEKKNIEDNLQQQAKTSTITREIEVEYESLKSFVDSRLKPLISNLKRTNLEKTLDLQAYEERIKKMENEQLARNTAEKNAASPREEKRCLGVTLAQPPDAATRLVQVEEEYEALKSYVNNRLKPLISALRRMNSEKSLDLEVSESQIKTFEKDLVKVQELQKEIATINEEKQSIEKALLTQAPAQLRIQNLEEEYAALKDYVDNRLKSYISRLRRISEERAIDLRANEEQIRKLECENKTIKVEMKTREKTPAKEIISRGNTLNTREECASPAPYAKDGLKNSTFRHKFVNDDKGLDMEGRATRAHDLDVSLSSLSVQAIEGSPSRKEFEKENEYQRYHLKPLEDTRSLQGAITESKRPAYGSTKTFVSALKSTTVSRNSKEKDIESMYNELQKECDELKDILRVPASASSQTILDAYRDEVRRRRKAEEEMNRMRQLSIRRPSDDKSLAAQSLSLSTRLGNLEAVVQDLRVGLEGAVHCIHETQEDGDKVFEYVLTLLASALPHQLSSWSASDLHHISSGNERLMLELRRRASGPSTNGSLVSSRLLQNNGS